MPQMPFYSPFGQSNDDQQKQQQQQNLVVRIGASPDTMQMANPNDELHPVKIKTAEFSGYVLIRINNYKGAVSDTVQRIESIPYFTGRKRMMSVQVQGRFSRSWSIEDLVWASDWERPLRVTMLVGGFFGKFWSMVDPGSTVQLGGDKPFVQSHVISSACTVTAWSAAPVTTMSTSASGVVPHVRAASENALVVDGGTAPSTHPESFRINIMEDISHIIAQHKRLDAEYATELQKVAGGTTHVSLTGATASAATPGASPRASTTGTDTDTTPSNSKTPRPSLFSRLRSSTMTPSSLLGPSTTSTTTTTTSTAANRESLVSCRRKLFATPDTRQSVHITPDTVFAFESFNPYFDPNQFRIKIPGVSMDLHTVLHGQPFRMALRTKDRSVVFFVIEIHHRGKCGGVGEDGLVVVTPGGFDNDGGDATRDLPHPS